MVLDLVAHLLFELGEHLVGDVVVLSLLAVLMDHLVHDLVCIGLLSG